jgi:hypothetical protein
MVLDRYSDYGVHAASYLINAKVVATAEEGLAMFSNVLNNSRTICSWSPFNQYVGHDADA